MSDHLGNETFSEDEKRLIKSIIYPSRDSDFDVDDAFGIFIGYEITVSDADKKLSNSDFREKIKNDIKNEVKNKFEHITKKIEEHQLYGHNFYIYILPITELNDTRMKIQKGITE
ncbi:Hachiman antiphage defense system protein HamA [Shewanella oncorhynchi]|uniref:Hachiman antiphage defense system protein HamA n=1 Tax=Shewanella oncorhynchi TaxID=2726434 RepID=UPI003D7AC58A